MKKWSNKTLTLLISIVLLAVNGGLLFSYYNFYLSDKMASDLSSARTENHNSIYVISKSIEGKSRDEALELIELYIKNNAIRIIGDKGGKSSLVISLNNIPKDTYLSKNKMMLYKEKVPNNNFGKVINSYLGI